jgi:hypothetical protein
MGVGLLFDSTLDRFLEAEGDRPGALWFFQHIPKTAGSSFRGELAERLRPSKNLAVDYRKGEDTLQAQRDAVLEQFLEEAAAGKYRFASGHVPHSSVARIVQARPNTRVVTMLRDPVQRLVSDYRYQLTELHPPHAEFRRRFPTFDEYARHPASQNKMYKFLMARPREPVGSVVRRMTDTYSFVGLQERYTLSFRLMALLLGEPAERPSLHARKTPSTADNALDPDALPIGALREYNHLDQAIYDHFRRLFDRRKRAIRDALRVVHQRRLGT